MARFCLKMYFWDLILKMKVTCMPIYCFAFYYLLKIPFFSVLELWHTWHIHILTGVQKGPISFWENDHILLKKVLLKWNVKVEDHLNAYCFVFSLTIYHNRGWKSTHWWLKRWSFFANKIYFLRLISHRKVTCMPIACFVFSLFALNIFISNYIHNILIVKMVQNGQISTQKMVIICYKCTFLRWISIWKFTWMSISSFIFMFLNVRSLFISS